jgi:hypothetical protein
VLTEDLLTLQLEITSFLFPDDIPKELINVGSPAVEDEDINDTLQDEVGLKQVLEILTKFSLFQSTRGDSLSASLNTLFVSIL